MKQKIFTLLLACLATSNALFADFDFNNRIRIGELVYALDSNKKLALVTSSDVEEPYAGDIIIPASVNYSGVDYIVSSIGGAAFENCTNLTSVVIPNTVTRINSQTFYGCSSLISVTIPNSVTRIGEIAFSGCTSLTSIDIPNSVTSIESEAFRGCIGLTSVTIPNSVTSFGNNVFSDCTGLTSATILDGFKSIGRGAFKGCSSLISVTIPNSVTSIAFEAFSGCCSLTSFVIPNSVTSMGDCVFADCSRLTSVTIPNSITKIGISVFYGCSSLTSVKIPHGITSIGNQAFSGCTGLTSVTCEATTPPSMGGNYIGNVFENVDCSNISLYVPKESINAYASADQWKDFYPNIFPITAEETTSTEVTATPDDNSVSISWPFVDGADTYINEILTNGELVCTLTFDAQGQLLANNYATPSRDGHVREVQYALQTANGWQYTVNGLIPGTEYSFTVTAKQGDSVLYTQSIEFHTNSLEPIDNVETDKAQRAKLLHNGQIFILRGNKTYTLTGQEVK